MYDVPWLDGVDLALVEIDAGGVEAGARELHGERQADVAEADHADAGGALVDALTQRRRADECDRMAHSESSSTGSDAEQRVLDTAPEARAALDVTTWR